MDDKSSWLKTALGTTTGQKIKSNQNSANFAEFIEPHLGTPPEHAINPDYFRKGDNYKQIVDSSVPYDDGLPSH